MHHNSLGTIGLTLGDMYVDHPNHHLGHAARYWETMLDMRGWVIYTQAALMLNSPWEGLWVILWEPWKPVAMSLKCVWYDKVLIILTLV